MLTLHHRRLHRAVEAHVDGELAGPLRAVVLRHLAECWNCSGDAETLRLIKSALRRRAQTPELPAVRLRRFAEGLLDRVR